MLDVELPIPGDELPMPGDETPVPDAVATVPKPNEASGSEPPKPAHARREPVSGGPDTLDVIGLTPCTGTSVAPRGTRVGGTGRPEPMPSGDVMPSGETPGETCAATGVQPNSAAAVMAIMKRVIGFNRIPSLGASCAAKLIDSINSITSTRANAKAQM